MLKQKHIPIRTCVSCRETDEKKGLLRIVRLPEGELQYDAKGKLNGRGAYVCASVKCITMCKKQKKLERALKVGRVPETLFETLLTNISEDCEANSQRRPNLLAAAAISIKMI